jgi:hypothetical protein
MDGIHRGAKRHVRGRVEFAGVGEMFEQLDRAKRCRSLSPWGSISVESDFGTTVMLFQQLRAGWQRGHEYGLNTPSNRAAEK